MIEMNIVYFWIRRCLLDDDRVDRGGRCVEKRSAEERKVRSAHHQHLFEANLVADVQWEIAFQIDQITVAYLPLPSINIDDGE